MTRDELVLKVQQSFIENTNKLGYINMNKEIASNILTDIENLVNIVYDDEAEVKKDVSVNE